MTILGGMCRSLFWVFFHLRDSLTPRKYLSNSLQFNGTTVYGDCIGVIVGAMHHSPLSAGKRLAFVTYCGAGLLLACSGFEGLGLGFFTQGYRSPQDT